MSLKRVIKKKKRVIDFDSERRWNTGPKEKVPAIKEETKVHLEPSLQPDPALGPSSQVIPGDTGEPGGGCVVQRQK